MKCGDIRDSWSRRLCGFYYLRRMLGWTSPLIELYGYCERRQRLMSRRTGEELGLEGVVWIWIRSARIGQGSEWLYRLVGSK